METSLQDCAGERQEPEKKPPEGIQLMMFNFLGMKDDQWENTKVLEGSEKYTVVRTISIEGRLYDISFLSPWLYGIRPEMA